MPLKTSVCNIVLFIFCFRHDILSVHLYNHILKASLVPKHCLLIVLAFASSNNEESMQQLITINVNLDVRNHFLLWKVALTISVRMQKTDL